MIEARVYLSIQVGMTYDHSSLLPFQTGWEELRLYSSRLPFQTPLQYIYNTKWFRVIIK